MAEGLLSWGDYYVTTLVDYPVKNLENALVHSDNIYFAKAACALGEKDFMKGLDSLGFGEERPLISRRRRPAMEAMAGSRPRQNWRTAATDRARYW